MVMFETKLNDFVAKCKALLDETIRLSEDTLITLSWVRLFDSLNASLTDILNEHARLLSGENYQHQPFYAAEILNEALSSNKPIWRNKTKPEIEEGELFENDGVEEDARSVASSSSFERPVDFDVEPLRHNKTIKPERNKVRWIPGIVKTIESDDGKSSQSDGDNDSQPKKKIKSNIRLRKHTRGYGKKRLLCKYECNECGAMFSRLKAFNPHMARHDRARDANCVGAWCAVCGIKSLTRNALSMHIKLSHLPRKKPKEPHSEVSCELCSAKLKSRATLKVHMKTVHTAEMTFVCEFCAFKTHSRRNLVSHLGIHANRSFTCTYEGCEAAFKTRGSLWSHIRYTHEKGKTIVCDRCALTFQSEYALKRHYETHTGVKKFACKVCGKAFRRPSHVVSHVRGVHRMQFDASLCQTFASDAAAAANNDSPVHKAGQPRKTFVVVEPGASNITSTSDFAAELPPIKGGVSFAKRKGGQPPTKNRAISRPDSVVMATAGTSATQHLQGSFPNAAFAGHVTGGQVPSNEGMVPASSLFNDLSFYNPLYGGHLGDYQYLPEAFQ